MPDGAVLFQYAPPAPPGPTAPEVLAFLARPNPKHRRRVSASTLAECVGQPVVDIGFNRGGMLHTLAQELSYSLSARQLSFPLLKAHHPPGNPTAPEPSKSLTSHDLPTSPASPASAEELDGSSRWLGPITGWIRTSAECAGVDLFKQKSGSIAVARLQRECLEKAEGEEAESNDLTALASIRETKMPRWLTEEVFGERQGDPGVRERHTRVTAKPEWLREEAHLKHHRAGHHARHASEPCFPLSFAQPSATIAPTETLGSWRREGVAESGPGVHNGSRQGLLTTTDRAYSSNPKCESSRHRSLMLSQAMKSSEIAPGGGDVPEGTGVAAGAPVGISSEG